MSTVICFKVTYNIKPILMTSAISYWNTDEEAANCQKKGREQGHRGEVVRGI